MKQIALNFEKMDIYLEDRLEDGLMLTFNLALVLNIKCL